MKFICRRCERLISQSPYRVTTEEGGVVLLDMLVCRSCARLARSLGLPVVKLETVNRRAVKTPSAEAAVNGKRPAVQSSP
jgi:hypothetical protein